MGDAELWVETDGFGRCRLAGNAHTFPGRISVWSETLAEWLTIDRRDIREASQEAWTWIDGFLSGSEPEFHEFLGIDGDYEFVPQKHESWSRYQAALKDFRLLGSFPFRLQPMPRKPPPADLSSEPWALAAGQVWRWNGSEWKPQDPQPELRGALIAGTICDERGHCLLDEGDENYAACRDCGSLTVLA